MRRHAALITATTLGLVLHAGAAASAFAGPPGEPVPTNPADAKIERIAQDVATRAPETATASSTELVVPTATTVGGAKGYDAGAVLVPSSGTGALDVASSPVSVGLPAEAEVGTGKVTSGSMVVFPGRDAADVSVAVAGRPDAFSVNVTIPDAAAPSRYTYELGGGTPSFDEDGDVQITDAGGEVVAFLDKPWAVDANGAAVPTRFEIEGTNLVQVVELDKATAFPVVADPDFIFIAKCSLAVVAFVAENVAIAAKFWKVFKSAKAFAKLMKSLGKMSKSGRIAYIKSKLGAIAADLSGIQDLVSRCTP